ncbi:MAG TPA: hypothetical protein VMY18_10950 [Acidobacteriota bacterium]|nr:hypothetical protein [Acidobacteriota bacterium]
MKVQTVATQLVSRTRILFLVLGFAVLIVGNALGQEEPGSASQAPSDPKAQLQQKLAALKQSLAENQIALQQYSWTETTEVSLKGEVKKREQKECRYGTDGKVSKTPIGESAASEPAKEDSAKPGRAGRRGRGAVKEKVVQNKVEDMKEYMGRAAELIKQYVPPEPAKIQAAQQAGKAALNKDISPGVSELAFTDYAIAGDKLTLALNTAALKIDSVTVDSYLDEPEDSVTLSVRFEILPDGISHPAETKLVAAAKEIQVKITNSDYRKAATE